MSKTFKLAALAALCAAATAASAGVTFDANFEGDTTSIDGATDSFKSNGRIEVNANAALLKQGDNFVNARASLLLGLNADSAVDDAWLQFGNSSLDFKFGRFEAVDLFPVGKDTVLERPNLKINDTETNVGYRANSVRGRFKDGQFHGALGFNAAPGLRFELGVMNFKDGATDKSGVRPAVTYTTGDLTLRAGYESFDLDGKGNKTGYGLSAGYALSKEAAVNVNYAKSSDLDASSVGANLVYGAAGVGYVQDKTGGNKLDTVYAAYSFPLLGVKGASITPAVSVSSGNSSALADTTALRVRLNYAF